MEKPYFYRIEVRLLSSKSMIFTTLKFAYRSIVYTYYYHTFKAQSSFKGSRPRIPIGSWADFFPCPATILSAQTKALYSFGLGVSLAVQAHTCNLAPHSPEDISTYCKCVFDMYWHHKDHQRWYIDEDYKKTLSLPTHYSILSPTICRRKNYFEQLFFLFYNNKKLND